MQPFTLLIPAYNEEESIQETVRSVSKVMPPECEVIIIDDGSKDNTYALAEKAIKGLKNFKLLRHERNQGKAHAIRTGSKHASNEIIAEIDADLTYPVNKIVPLVNELLKDDLDLIVGSRFTGRIKDMPFIRNFGNRVLNYWVSFLTLRRVTDSTSGLRAWRNGLLDELRITARSLELEIEMTTKAVLKGKRFREVPIEYDKRSGSSKLKPFKDGWLFFKVALKAKFGK